ncbi:winged helix family two component transcriptional regulator [Paenibacillus taihuensis]|uniref:Winged helix family two component transcriptional regulator n=1 Tax=Paenibacillus taihuensis TaxID=1156355 RepID=A0A3D9R032_9BACL|nr:response regulator transcription factor [Paenibacillus taihuensis]REE66737.1 winged helix family two component transcriptional regulator [Paenibacillus taihuensis]
MRILVVEDDPSLLGIIRGVFESESFQTDTAETGDDGYFMAQQAIYDLIVLDVMLPGMSGVDIVRSLQSSGHSVPIILLTAKDAVKDRVAGLDAGADDYITKPFAVEELLARSRAVLRRRGTLGAEGDLIYGPYRLSPATREAFIGETLLALTSTEFVLLEFMVCNLDRILTREQIFDRVWGFESRAGITAVDVYVHHLRKKLAAAGAEHCIRTIRGIGFMLKGEIDV